MASELPGMWDDSDLSGGWTDTTDSEPRPCYDPSCTDFAIHGTPGCLVHIPTEFAVSTNQQLTEGMERRPTKPPPGLHGYNPGALPDNPDIPARPY